VKALLEYLLLLEELLRAAESNLSLKDQQIAKLQKDIS
jgi:hypothetical protein